MSTPRQLTIDDRRGKPIEAQTDITYVNGPTPINVHRSAHSQEWNLENAVGTFGIFKPTADSQIMEKAVKLLEDLRQTGRLSPDLDRRLSALETELTGILGLQAYQRNQRGEGTEFYKTVTQLSKELTAAECRYAMAGSKMEELENMNRRLSKELEDRKQVITQLTQKEGTFAERFKIVDLYADYFNKTRSFKDKFTPVINDLVAKIDAATNALEAQERLRASSTTMASSSSETESAKAMLSKMEMEIRNLQKDGQLNLGKVNDMFINVLAANRGMIKSGDLRRDLEEAEVRKEEQRVNLKLKAVLKGIHDLIAMNPELKATNEITKLLELVKQRGVDALDCKGWIALQPSYQGETYVELTDQTVRDTITLISVQMRKLLREYPQMKEVLSGKLVQFLNLDILEDTVSNGSLDRLKQIIVYKNDVLRVDNVYKYSSEQDRKAMFNMRVLIKSLLEELERIRLQTGANLTLDEGILALLRDQVLDGIDTDAIIGLYRPPPKIIEVNKVLETPVMSAGHSLERHIPVKVEKAVVFGKTDEIAVEVHREVPVYVEKIVDREKNIFVEVETVKEKILEVNVIREKISEKVIENERMVEVPSEKIVPLETVMEIPKMVDREVIVYKPEIIEVPTPYAKEGEKIFVEVECIVEKPVYLNETREVIKEVEVIREKLFKQTEYKEIDKTINVIVKVPEVVQIEKQVPKYITNVLQVPVDVKEVRLVPAPYKVTEDKPIQVPLVTPVEVVREVEKEVIVETTHFIKGDREEVIKQVEVRIEKPFIHEVLVTKDVQIERMVPLMIREDRPVYEEVRLPYRHEEVRIVKQEVPIVVPLRQEIIKQIAVETPVPVLVEKEIIRTEPIYITQIVEKIVEVPRVVEIERIVEKIVVVPRIIERIVEVPRDIERIKIVEVPVLQIVEIIKEVPVIQTIEVIKEVIVEKIVYEIVKEIEIVTMDKIVEIIREVEVPRIVELERRIPVELIREVPVDLVREVIVEKTIELHEITVKDREVVVPFIHERLVETPREVPVYINVVHEVIKNVPEIIEIEKPMDRLIKEIELVEIFRDRPIYMEIIHEVPGQDKIIYIDRPVEVHIIEERIVEVVTVREIPREVTLIVEKPTIDRVEVPKPYAAPQLIRDPYIVTVNEPVHYYHYKEKPVEVQTTKNIELRSIIHSPYEVITEHEKIVQVEVLKERLKEVMNVVKDFVIQEVAKEISNPIVVREPQGFQVVEVPGETQYLTNVEQTTKIETVPHIVEKIVEKIIMLPQIVEITKHIHEISEVKSLGIASGVSKELHTKNYIGVSQDLQTGLVDLLNNFKANAHRQPDLRALISIIEKYLPVVDDWIRFPKILEVTKQVEKIVQKDRAVLVPWENAEMQATMSFMVEDMIKELRRLKEKFRVDLNLDERVKRIFFSDQNLAVFNKERYDNLRRELQRHYSSFGTWADSHPFLVSSFLEDHIILTKTIEEYARRQDGCEGQLRDRERDLETVRLDLLQYKKVMKKLESGYESMYLSLKNDSEISQVAKIRRVIEAHSGLEDIVSYLAKLHREAKDTFNTGHGQTLMLQESFNKQEGMLKTNISELVARLNIKDQERDTLLENLREYQNEVEFLRREYETLRSFSGTSKLKEGFEEEKRQIIDNYEREMNRLRLGGGGGNESEGIKKLNERNRQLERDLDTEKRNWENKLRQVERELENEKRGLENQKKQFERQLQREIENQKGSYEVEIRRLKESLEQRDARLKSTSNISSLGEKEGEIRTLKDTIRRLESQIELIQKRDYSSTPTRTVQSQLQINDKTLRSPSSTQFASYIGVPPQGYQSQINFSSNQIRQPDDNTNSQTLRASRSQILEVAQSNSQISTFGRGASSVISHPNLPSQVQVTTGYLNPQSPLSADKYTSGSNNLIGNSNNVRQASPPPTFSSAQNQLSVISQSGGSTTQSQFGTSSQHSVSSSSQQFGNAAQGGQSSYLQQQQQNQFSSPQPIGTNYQNSPPGFNQYNSSSTSAIKSGFNQVQPSSTNQTGQGYTSMTQPGSNQFTSTNSQLAQGNTQGSSFNTAGGQQGYSAQNSLQFNQPSQQIGQQSQLQTPQQQQSQILSNSQRSIITSQTSTISPGSLQFQSTGSVQLHPPSPANSARSAYPEQMPLRDFIEMKDNEAREKFAHQVILKVIEKIDEEAKKTSPPRYRYYLPKNIVLTNFDPKNMEKMTIKLGTPITDIHNDASAPYIAPEVLNGLEDANKSIVFTIGAIYDEILHRELFFHNASEVTNPQMEFKVRDLRLNPILKNTLFEMMSKLPSKRLDLNEAKRRLVLQNYISKESESRRSQ